MISCDIVLTVYDKIDLTRNCLESVVRHFRPGDRIIVVDNGSGEETRAFLGRYACSHPEAAIEIVRLERNQGYLCAANEGLRRSSRDAVCLLSNDTVVTAGWLDRMCGLMESQPHIGIVNPMSTTFGLYPHAGQTPEDVARSLARERGRYTECAGCVGFCMLIKREVIRAVGVLDEIYADGYFEDTDFCRRAIASGFTCAIARDAYVWHAEHATFDSGERETLFVKNRRIFEERWGRPTRSIYVASGKAQDRSRIIDECLQDARRGNWIWLLVPRDEKSAFAPCAVHGNIRLIGVGRYALWLYPWFLYLCKRKKPIDKVLFR